MSGNATAINQTFLPGASPVCDSAAEELANAVTHGVGAVLAAAGMAVLVWLAAERADATAFASLAVYGLCLTLLYLASTLYHWATTARAKLILQRCDHAAIYLMIAGTYTPICLLVVGGAMGQGLLAGVWVFALVGAVCKATGRLCYGAASTALYLALGRLALVAFGPMMQVAPFAFIQLLLLGGAAYTLGTVFFHWDRMPYNHAVWHLCTLAGSAFHFFAILHYAVPAAT